MLSYQNFVEKRRPGVFGMISTCVAVGSVVIGVPLVSYQACTDVEAKRITETVGFYG